MLPASSLRASRSLLSRQLCRATTTSPAVAARRTFAVTATKASSAETPAPASPDNTALTTSLEGEAAAVQQAPNRAGVWTRSQQPREKAMTGPRFEQTDFSLQPQPYSAMELIHQQPVRWTHDRIVSCDGGGGPAGHPRIFINTDKPQICTCGYCGVPYANEHHRAHLESLPQTSYPLE